MRKEEYKMQKEESRKINRTKEIRERFQAEKDTEKKTKEKD